MGKGSGTCQRQALTFEADGTGGSMTPRSRSVASILGISCGDALGFPTELIKTKFALEKRYGVEEVLNLTPGNKSKIGAYSDDTQQTLMIARCIKPNGVFDIERWAKKELPYWWEYYRGAGYTSSVAVEALQNGADWDDNFFNKQIIDSSKQTRQIDYRKSDSNGTVMRVAPLGIALGKRPAALKQAIWMSSITTHGHPGAALAAHLHAQSVSIILEHPDAVHNLPDILLEKLETETLPEEAIFDAWKQKWESEGDNLQQTFLTSKSEIEKGLKSLQKVNQNNLATKLKNLGVDVKPHKTRAIPSWLCGVAIAVAYKGDAQSSMIYGANYLGSDTDTLAAISGGLCGASDGGQSRPETWDAKIQDAGYLQKIGKQLYDIRDGKAKRSPGYTKTDKDLPSLYSIVENNSLKKGSRIGHPVLGNGKVTKIKDQYRPKNESAEQEIPRYINILFDCGQSCRFRSDSLLKN